MHELVLHDLGTAYLAGQHVLIQQEALYPSFTASSSRGSPASVAEDDPDSSRYAESPDLNTVISYITGGRVLFRASSSPRAASHSSRVAILCFVIRGPSPSPSG